MIYQNYFTLTPTDTGLSPFKGLYVGGTGDIAAVRARYRPPIVLSDATAADPAVLTVPVGHSYVAGDVIKITGAVGTSTGDNWSTINGNCYEIASVDATTLTLSIDASGLNTYTASSGAVTGVGDTVIFAAIPVGFHELHGLRVSATGTTATDLVGIES